MFLEPWIQGYSLLCCQVYSLSYCWIFSIHYWMWLFLPLYCLESEFSRVDSIKSFKRTWCFISVFTDKINCSLQMAQKPNNMHLSLKSTTCFYGWRHGSTEITTSTTARCDVPSSNPSLAEAFLCLSVLPVSRWVYSGFLPQWKEMQTWVYVPWKLWIIICLYMLALQYAANLNKMYPPSRPAGIGSSCPHVHYRISSIDNGRILTADITSCLQYLSF